MPRSNHIDMLSGPILSRLLLFALPLAASSILQQLFNSADMAVVGHFAGPQAMAAVGGNSAVINVLVNLFVGLSVGANVVIASAVGLRKAEKASEAVHTSMTLALLGGVFLMFVGIFAARPILELIDTPHDVLELAVVYLQLYFLGMPFIMVYNFGAAVLRSVGDTRRPLYILIVAGVINVLLNMLLVIVFELSVTGVGVATLISNVVSAGMILFFLMREDDIIRLDLRRLGFMRAHLTRIVRIGAPAGVQGMMFSVSNVFIQAAINGFGSAPVAGSATALNFEFFSYFLVSAFGQAAVTFTSQNYAACSFDRCDRVFRLSMLWAVLTTGASCALFAGFAEFFTRLYITDPEVVGWSVQRILFVERYEWLTVVYEIGAASLRGMGVSLLPALITMAGSCLFRILWIYTLFSWTPSFERLMDVYPVSWILMGAAMTAAYILVRRKLFRERGGVCVPEE
ncbi:MATE family efflux transporter [Mailhella sp.]|uniref:MATE family efflux transporter n=1 Tax=Mailhella sp. TaxID=1981029 RepID=UPI004064AA5A